MVTSLLMLSLLGSPAQAPDVVVVCPAQFRQALAPWVKHRTEQGHRIKFVSNTQSSKEIRKAIGQQAARGQLRFVLLVGDAEPGMDKNADLRARCVPTHFAKAKINIRWGSEPEIATDNWYADLNDDNVPDLSIGRLTADSPKELSQIVGKILAYERSTDFGLWRRRVSFVTGVGGFGKFADMVLESSTKKLICDSIPNAFPTTMTQASWRSPHCPDPRAFRQATLDRLNEGCLFWVYVGHGQLRELDRVIVPGNRYPILSARDMDSLQSVQGFPIACFLACYTGAFDQQRDCLAEEMLRTPGGPVAILSGSRVTMPYAMAVLGTGMLDELFQRKRATLGEVLLHAKRNMMAGSEKNGNRPLLDLLATAISPAPVDLKGERTEHLHLFNLIGDPMLRLRYGREIKVEVASEAMAGSELDISGTCPIDGRCTLELVVRRDRLTFARPTRSQYDPSPEALKEFGRVYLKANDPRLVWSEVKVQGGKFHARLHIPKNARGACHVRAFVQGASDYALGAADIQIK